MWDHLTRAHFIAVEWMKDRNLDQFDDKLEQTPSHPQPCFLPSHPWSLAHGSGAQPCVSRELPRHRARQLLEAARRSGAVLSIAPCRELCRDGSGLFSLLVQLFLQLPSRCLCARAGLGAPTAIPHRQPPPLALLPAGTAPGSPWQAAAWLWSKFGLENQRKLFGGTGFSSLPRSAACSAGTGHSCFWRMLKMQGSPGMQELPRLVWDPSKWFPMPPVYHLLPIPSKKAVLAEAGEGGGLFCLQPFPIWQSNAKRWSCAEQSSLWQSAGEAAAQHGIRITEHNDR